MRKRGNKGERWREREKERRGREEVSDTQKETGRRAR